MDGEIMQTTLSLEVPPLIMVSLVNWKFCWISLPIDAKKSVDFFFYAKLKGVLEFGTSQKGRQNHLPAAGDWVHICGRESQEAVESRR